MNMIVFLLGIVFAAGTGGYVFGIWGATLGGIGAAIILNKIDNSRIVRRGYDVLRSSMRVVISAARSDGPINEKEKQAILSWFSFWADAPDEFTRLQTSSFLVDKDSA